MKEASITVMVMRIRWGGLARAAGATCGAEASSGAGRAGAPPCARDVGAPATAVVVGVALATESGEPVAAGVADDDTGAPADAIAVPGAGDPGMAEFGSEAADASIGGSPGTLAARAFTSLLRARRWRPLEN